MYNLVPMSRGSMQAPKSLFDVEGLFESFFNQPLFPGFSRNMADLRVDIRDSEKEYILEADLPGLSKEDLQLEFKDNCLTISVEKNEKTEEENGNYLRRERRSQSISRTIAFNGVNDQEIKAKYENGVLKVTLPKLESPISKHRIEIE